jgi:hypothetical protein
VTTTRTPETVTGPRAGSAPQTSNPMTTGAAVGPTRPVPVAAAIAPPRGMEVLHGAASSVGGSGSLKRPGDGAPRLLRVHRFAFPTAPNATSSASPAPSVLSGVAQQQAMSDTAATDDRGSHQHPGRAPVAGGGFAQTATASGGAGVGGAAAVAALLLTVLLMGAELWRRVVLPAAGWRPVTFVSLLERPG